MPRLKIIPKKKKCKGTGPAKGYGCGEMTYHRHYGLCKSKCYPDWLLNSELGKIKMQKAYLKAAKPRKELERASDTRKKEKRLPVALNQAQLVFNRYIRLRDKGLPCISSSVPYREDFDAGHLYSVKQYSGLRFDEDNCHAQSIGENRFNEGNFESYILNVRCRIGEERFNALQERAAFYKANPKKWAIHEVEEIKKIYQDKIKNLNQ